MSNTRSLRNRSSRYSSPATFTAVNQQESTLPVQETIEVQRPQDGLHSQSTLDKWVEPEVRQSVPSFEDNKGLERVGVLEHMQALGQGPNQKLLQRLKVNYRPSLSARATPGYSEGIASPSVEPAREDVVSPVIDPELLLDAPTLTPSPAPPLSTPAFQPQPQPPTLLLAMPQAPHTSPILQPELLQQPLQPGSIPQLQEQPPRLVIMSPPRGRPAKKEVEEMRVYPGAADATYSPSTTNNVSRAARASSRTGSVPAQPATEQYRGYLQNAIGKAHSDGKWEVAAGLNRVLAELGRDEVATALENISKYKASVRVEQFKVFKKYVKKGIRKHRQHSHQAPYSNNAQGPPPAPAQAQPVAYVSSFHANSKRPSLVDPAAFSDNATKAPSGIPTNEPDTRPFPSYSVAERLAAGDDITVEQPSQLSAEQSFHLPPARTLGQPPILPIRPSPRKRRSSSVSSLSSLLSFPTDSSISPPPGMANQHQAAEGRPTRTSVTRQAPARAASSKATRLSSALDQPSDQPLSDSTPAASLDTIRVATATPTQHDVGLRSKRQKLTQPLPPDYDPEEIERHRQAFEQASEQDYNYRPKPRSFIRHPVERKNHENPPIKPVPYSGPPPPVVHSNPLPLATSIAIVSSPASQQGGLLIINGTGLKRNYDRYAADDDSELSSPAPSTSSQPPPPSARVRVSVGASSTRASTPRAASKIVQPLKARTQPRMMVSPRKPRIGVSNSVAARAGISKDTTVANGVDASEENIDNEDQCRACGDEGLLLLCEGCPNSFHGDCLEPPVDPASIEGEWYCPECENKRGPINARHNGLMSELVDNIIDAYPKAYNLPFDIRNYFEFVRTGDDGEYIEMPAPVQNKKGAPRTDSSGALKAPDFKATRDPKGNVRLCYKCSGTTEGEREMIPCDYCPYEWHIDCLNPPQAIIPKRYNTNGKPVQPWRCPLHIDDILSNIGRAPGAMPRDMGRKPRLRRPKNAKPLEPYIPRRPHFMNNGVIEVQLEPEDPQLDVKTVNMGGGVFRLPEKEIKLDFIDKAREKFYDDMTIPRRMGLDTTKFHTSYWRPDSARYRDRFPRSQWSDNDNQDMEESSFRGSDISVRAEEEAQSRLRQKTFIEQRTVLGLTELASSRFIGSKRSNDVEHTGIGSLVNQLIADAPEEAAERINLSEEEQLETLMRLTQQRLDIVKGRNEGANKCQIRPQSNGSQRDTGKLNGTLGHDHGE